MENITASAFSVISLSVISTLVCGLIGKGSFYASLKAVCSLSVLLSILTLLSPLFSILTDIAYINFESDLNYEDDDEFDSSILDESCKYISEYTKDMICLRFSIKYEDFTVHVDVDDSDKDNILINRITVTFITQPPVGGDVIADYVANELLCPITVLLP